MTARRRPHPVDIDALCERLRALGTEDRAVNEKRYLKSDLEFLGAKVPDIRKAAKAALRAAEPIDHDAFVALIEDLWAEPVHELRMAAVQIAYARPERFELEDLGLLERMLRESRTWAYVDTLAAGVVGPLLARHPDEDAILDAWAEDEDFWIRRTALLTHLGPLRRGEGDWDRFTRYADAMLDEKEFFIRKAIGWVLRDAARKQPELVYDWILPRAHRASGVTIREVVRHLPDAMAEAAKERYRAR
jgi:3-methyladenine DNA glycosylase AlkD